MLTPEIEELLMKFPETNAAKLREGFEKGPLKEALQDFILGEPMMERPMKSSEKAMMKKLAEAEGVETFLIDLMKKWGVVEGE